MTKNEEVKTEIFDFIFMREKKEKTFIYATLQGSLPHIKQFHFEYGNKEGISRILDELSEILGVKLKICEPQDLI